MLNGSIYDGGIYELVDPLLGCTHGTLDGQVGGSWQGRLGELLIDGGAARAVFWPIAIAGSSIADWAPGGKLNHRIRVTSRRLRALGHLGHVSAVLSHIGEADNALGTTKTEFASALASVHRAFREEGIAAPIVNALSTRQNDGTISSAVRQAMIEAADRHAGIWVGPDSDTIDDTGRDRSHGHFNAAGSQANAANWRRALTRDGVLFA